MKFANFIVEKIRDLPEVEIVIDDNFFQPLSPNQLFEIHDRIFKETSLGIYGGAFFKHRSYFVDQNLLDGDDMEQVVICAAGAFVLLEKENFSAEFLEAASGTNASELFEIVARDDNTNFLLALGHDGLSLELYVKTRFLPLMQPLLAHIHSV
ncbi:hypothetical protein EON80_05365 [bacterium]|nr:MAG: hypothetical protein EON80_05365 [bacterium]